MSSTLCTSRGAVFHHQALFAATTWSSGVRCLKPCLDSHAYPNGSIASCTSTGCRPGAHDTGFLIDKNRLFEVFVTQLLRARVPAGLTISAQASMRLDHEGRIKLCPDIVIRHGDAARVVADCKYKRTSAGDTGNNGDLYQLLAYCTRLGVSRGLLIYPAGPHVWEGDVTIRNTPIVVRAAAIDLGSAREDAIRECDRFAERVFAFGPA